MASGHCTNCGAQLPFPGPGQPFVKCHFCGHVTPLTPPPPAPPPPAPPRQEYLRRVQGSPRAATPLTSIVVALVFVVVSVGASVFRIFRPNLATNRVGSIVAAVGQSIQWDSQYAPNPAHINGDGIEDFVGVYRVVSTATTTPVEMVGGFDGATLDRVWAAGPFGDGGNTRGFQITVVGSRVVVTDSRSTVHVLDVMNGKEVSKVVLSDRAKGICPTPGKSEVWIEVSDEQNVTVDLNSGIAKRATRPSYCRQESTSVEEIRCAVSNPTTATCKGADSFHAPNFRADRMLVEGDLSVVVGTKAPGSGVPTAVGTDSKGKRVLWQRPLPQRDPSSVKDGLGLVDMGGGKLIAQLALTSGFYELSALDAKTGNPLWETVIAHSKEGSEASRMTVTAARVYLPHWAWLDVFDANTGTVIGTVGKW